MAIDAEIARLEGELGMLNPFSRSGSGSTADTRVYTYDEFRNLILRPTLSNAGVDLSGVDEASYTDPRFQRHGSDSTLKRVYTVVYNKRALSVGFFQNHKNHSFCVWKDNSLNLGDTKVSFTFRLAEVAKGTLKAALDAATT